MNWHLTPLSGLILLAAVIPLGLLVLARLRPAMLARPQFCMLLVALIAWQVGYSLEWGTQVFTQKLFWAQVQYLGIVWVPLLWALLVAEATHQSNWLQLPRIRWLAVLPMVTLILTWTNDAHGLVWSRVTLSAGGATGPLHFEHGPWFWLNVFYTYFLVALSWVWMVQELRRPLSVHRRQVTLLLGISTLPVAANLAYLIFRQQLNGLDLTPAGLGLAALVYGLAVAWDSSYVLLPVARAALIEALQDGVVVMDAANRILDINPAARSMLSNPKEEVISRPVGAALPFLDSLVANPVPQSEIELSPGRFVEARTIPLKNRSAFVGHLILLRDISKRKQAELALQDSELKFRTLVQVSSDAIFIIDNETGQILDVNEAGPPMYGYTREELLSLKNTDVSAQPQETRTATHSTEIGQVLVPVRYHRRKDGTVFPVEIIGKAFEWKGRMVHAAAIRDISERVRVDKQLEGLLKAERIRVKQLDALRMIWVELATEFDLKSLLSKILENARSLLSADTGELVLYEPEADHLRVVSSCGLEKDTSGDIVEMGEGLMGLAAKTKQPLLVKGYQGWENRSPRYATIALEEAVGAPMLSGGVLLGAVALGSYRPSTFDAASMDLLNLYVQQASLAIHNARLFEQLNDLAVTDTLTGLFNRRHFFYQAESLVIRAQRYGSPLSAVMIDLDHFKDINDTFGHSAGDHVLREVARALSSALRKSDLIGRYGGEEFCVLLPEIDLEEGRTAAERLRQEVFNLQIPTLKGTAAVTASLGVAALNLHGETLDQLLQRADAALYRAKRAGRNAVSVEVGGGTDVMVDGSLL
ncbi:diguanylate cyclase [Levilinea saccharolytica]|nr:diguanylate cyclase [Levilinea saccharolytica]